MVCCSEVNFGGQMEPGKVSLTVGAAMCSGLLSVDAAVAAGLWGKG